MFRPFPWETNNESALIASCEGLFLLFLIVSRRLTFQARGKRQVDSIGSFHGFFFPDFLNRLFNLIEQLWIAGKATRYGIAFGAAPFISVQVARKSAANASTKARLTRKIIHESLSFVLDNWLVSRRR